MDDAINIEELERLAIAVKDWRCDRSWMDTSDDEPAFVVGTIDEDGNEYPVITVDCEQYFSGDSKKLADFYACANPDAVLSLVARLKSAEAERNGLRSARIAYASEFGLDNEGMPDVGNIHRNIRRLKAERDGLAADVACGAALLLKTDYVRIQELEEERDALAAKLAEQSVPDGYCIAPSTRGYARMGAGRYVLQPCLADVDGAEVPSLVIRLATEDECNRRTVGDLEDTPEEEVGVPMDENLIVCQLDFVSDMGLYALQQQLRLLRHYHFPGTEDPECKSLSPIKATAETVAASDSTAANWIDKARDAIAAAESAPKAVRLTEDEIGQLDRQSREGIESLMSTWPVPLARAIEVAVLRKNGIEA